MRIAHFSGTLKNGQDGVVRVVTKLIEKASEQRYPVSVFTASPPKVPEITVPVYRVPSVPFPLQRAYRLAVPGLRYFEKQLDLFAPELLHIHSPCTLGFGALRYARHRRVPVIATYHTHFPTYLSYYHISPMNRLCWYLLRRFYNNVSGTIVPSRTVMQELCEHGIGRLTYIPNGVDTRAFHPSYYSYQWRDQFSGGLRKPIVLFVSRLVWEKNLKVLAEAYRMARSVTDNFSMVVVGDGHARRELQAMMPDAYFMGFTAGRDLSVAYASSDIFVFPSTTETFGLVTVEAMASGCVPIAARMGGAVDIIENNLSGFLVAPSDAKEMAEKIVFLLENPGVRKAMAENARMRVNEYSWESVLDKTFRFYDAVVSGSGPAGCRSPRRRRITGKSLTNTAFKEE
jgi:phosphatidylinositol alpha 1,6-mannosyltransferase